MADHEWGKSKGEGYEPADLVNKLEEQIQSLPEEKVREAEERIKEAVAQEQLTGEILGTVMSVLKGMFLALAVMALCLGSIGCIGVPAAVVSANDVQREALVSYAKNQATLHRAEQAARSDEGGHDRRGQEGEVAAQGNDDEAGTTEPG